MPAVAENNPAGFWESLDIYALNEEMLRQAGSRWDDWCRVDPKWFRSSAAIEFRSQAASIIESEYGGSTLFVLKDPRLCLLLPFWIDVLRDLAIQPKCILPLRSPLDTAASLKERDGFGVAKGSILWLRHVLEAELATRHLDRAFVSYDALLENWHPWAASLASQLGLTWPSTGSETEAQIDGFLAQGLRHHNASERALCEHPELAPVVLNAYGALRDFQHKPYDEHAIACLDEVRDRFDATCHLFAPVLQPEPGAASTEDQALSARIAPQDPGRIGAIDERMAQLALAVDRTQHRLGELERNSGALESRVADLESSGRRQQALLDEATRQADRAEKMLKTLSSRIADHAAWVDEFVQDLSGADDRPRHTASADRQPYVAPPDGDMEMPPSPNAQRAEAMLADERRNSAALVESRNQLLFRLNEINCSATWQLSKPLRWLEARSPGALRAAAVPPKIFWWTLTGRLAPRLRLRRDALRLLRGQQFDVAEYIQRNPTVVLDGVNPVIHRLLTAPPQPAESTHQQDVPPQEPPPERQDAGRESTYPSGPGRPAPAREESLPGTASALASDAGETPLAREVREIYESRLFDTTFYLNEYPEVARAGADPVEHYCRRGWREGKDPNDTFDTRYYLEHHEDVAESGRNPFHHFVLDGKREGRRISREQPSRDGYESQCRFGPIETDIKAIAFYLPQFHRIPQNDEWWGPGFTEWTNVRTARPLFEDHDQPRIPHPDIGYYDLSDRHVLEKQARLAAQHGVYGFCFYHYYFNGQRLLEKPVNLLLQHPEIDLKFCLCWANENWTRVWDGGSDHVLIAQEYSPADDLRFIDDLSVYLEDSRYIRVDGRPLILVYRPGLLPDMAATAQRWRERMRQRGIGELYLVATYGAFGEEKPPAEYGCDAALEFPPNIHIPGQKYFNYGWEPGFSGNINSYPQFMKDLKSHRERLPQDFVLYRSVMLRWDNTPRRQEGGTVYRGFTAERYRRWLDYAFSQSRRTLPPGRRFVFINAWNEWAEGAYLEPDMRYGYRLLNETSRALLGLRPGRPLPKVSVIVPNYNHARYLRQRLDSIYNQTYQNIEVILLDDASADESRSILDEYAVRRPGVTQTHFNDINSGGVFRQWRAALAHATGDLVWIAESDDFCETTFLDSLVAAFEDEAVVLAYSRYEFVDEHGEIRPQGFENYVGVIDEQKWRRSYVNTAHAEVAGALGIRNTIPNASGAVFRRPIGLALLDDAEWLDMRVAGDWVFYLHILRGGKIAYRNDTTSYFRFHGSNSSVATYATSIYYKEHGIVAAHVARLYDVPEETLRANYRITKEFYRQFVPDGSTDELEALFNFPRVEEERARRGPNILISALAFSSGGAETTPVTVANEMKRRGESVLFHSRDFSPDNPRIRRRLRSDIPVVRAAHARELRKIIDGFGIEVANTHHHAVQQMAAKDPGVFGDAAHVGTLHGVFEVLDEASRSILDSQLPSINRCTQLWTYVADKNVDPFLERGLYSGDRFIKIPNGLPTGQPEGVRRDSLGIPSDGFLLCLVSRAIPEKGWWDAIEIVRRARMRSNREIHLLLVGDGPVHTELVKVGTEPFVHLIGFSDQPIAYLAASDMGFLPSTYHGESMPNVIIESLLAGKPVIASDLGEVRNMLGVGDALAGGVIPVDDWVLDLERATDLVCAFANDPELYRQALALVPGLADRFRIENVVDQYLNVFDAAVELRHGTAEGHVGANASSPRTIAVI